MFLYLGHLVGVARHLTGVVPYPLVFLRDTGVMNSGCVTSDRVCVSGRSYVR